MYDSKKRRERYLRNRDKELAGRKRYAETHKEQESAYFKEYYKKNREKIIQRVTENRRKKKMGQLEPVA
jgi:hypothetical protein